ncbi:hypothetical protein JCM1840_001424 [Sporobolomyces johnsonii]
MSAPSTSTAPSTAPSATPTDDEHPAPEPYFDQQAGKWMVETPDGNELEWDQARGGWVPVVDDELLKAQQAAYAVQGVDESTPAAPLTKEEKKLAKKKRKADDSTPSGSNGQPPASKKPRANTAIFISHLPASTTAAALERTFSKAGLILEDATGAPKIKLYHDAATGKFKGEALVVYLQEASVELAVRLFDQTELELGSGDGVMSVAKAEWDSSKGGGPDKKKETATGGGANGRDDQAKRTGKRAAALRQKLGDWSSDDEDPLVAAARARKYRGVVVLEGMFTLQELDEDATLLLDLKEDVRDECERLGEVTNVTLYDKEDKGIMTVRFKDDLAAQACIAKMNNRFFAGRTIRAYPMDGSVKYRKSTRADEADKADEADEDKERKEAERLDKYAEWLEKGGE